MSKIQIVDDVPRSFTAKCDGLPDLTLTHHGRSSLTHIWAYGTPSGATGEVHAMAATGEVHAMATTDLDVIASAAYRRFLKDLALVSGPRSREQDPRLVGEMFRAAVEAGIF